MKKIKKQGFFKKNYSECFKFLLETKNYVVFSLTLFLFFFLIGFTFPVFFEEQIRSFMETMVNLLEGMSILELINYIFFNNLKASFFALFLGILFGFFPLMVVVVNGYLLGFISRFVAEQEGIFVLWRLFPHGIFELPAIILSIGVGLKLGMEMFSYDGRKNIKKNIIKSLKFFLLVIIPLLVIAAIIEGILIGLNV